MEASRPAPTNAPIRVVLIGSERVTRAGLRMLIESHGGIRVVNELEWPGEVGTIWSSSQRQVVVVDLDRPGILAAIPDLRTADTANTRVIVLTGAPDTDTCSSAIHRGILGIVSKQQAPEVLIKAIERVHAGEVWLNRAKIAGVVGDLRASVAAKHQRRTIRPEALTPRERQIITLVGQGFRNSEIATGIFVSEATVRNCLGSIFKKLEISNRVHLMIYAIHEGFVNITSGNSPNVSSPRDVLRLATSAGRPLGDGQS
jgi:DNA-binding NarL/FixJ family response regulator